jgi:hypothetical protein
MLEGNIMKFRKYVVAAAIMTTMAGTSMALMGSGQANASGSTIETVNTSRVMVNSKCYETYTTAITYYTHSVTRGWVKEPSPKVVKSKKETCLK